MLGFCLLNLTTLTMEIQSCQMMNIYLMSETAYISCSENAQHDDSRTQTNHIANSSDFTDIDLL